VPRKKNGISIANAAAAITRRGVPRMLPGFVAGFAAIGLKSRAPPGFVVAANLMWGCAYETLLHVLTGHPHDLLKFNVPATITKQGDLRLSFIGVEQNTEIRGTRARDGARVLRNSVGFHRSLSHVPVVLPISAFCQLKFFSTPASLTREAFVRRSRMAVRRN
jgi:hypothetical protein